MAQYATPSELASYLQQDLDASTANLALTTASGEFSRVADTWWTATAVTYSTVGTRNTNVILPFRPVTAVSAVRIAGVVVTGYTLVKNVLYRALGFGNPYQTPPDLLEVDLTYGYTTVPDAVKLAVLEIAAGIYANPTRALSESIDDYTIRFESGSVVPAGPPWRSVAATYRGTYAA